MIENENSLIIIGRPAITNYAILAGLIIGIPLTSWGMWQSGEVSLIFVFLFALGFGLAAPFIINDLVKPALRKAGFDRRSRKIKIVMAGLFSSTKHEKMFHEIGHIELRLTPDATESPSGGKRYHHSVIIFDDGTELIASSQNRQSRQSVNISKSLGFWQSQARILQRKTSLCHCSNTG